MKPSSFVTERSEEKKGQGENEDQATPDAAAVPSVADLERRVQELEVRQRALALENAQLRDSRAALDAVLAHCLERYDSAPVGYFSLDRDGVMTSINLAGASLLGQERVRLKGQRFVAFVVEPHRPIFNAFLEKVFATKRKDSCRVDLDRCNQPAITVQIEMNLSSQVPECRAAVVDITERKQMERRLWISEERYRRLAETAIDVIWTMNLEGTFTFVSPSVMQLRGFTPEEVMQQRFEDIFPPASLALVQQQFNRFLGEFQAGLPTGTMRLELEHKCKDGSTVWTDVIACLPVSAESSFVEILGITRDISERKQAEAAQRQRLAERLRMQEREQLLQDLHDGFASQLASAHLRNQYSVLTRVEMGELLRECLDDLHLVVETLGFEEFSLNDAIADYRYRCEGRLSGLGIEFDWTIELSHCPPLAQKALLNLLRVLQESLNNAVKHAQARRIEVVARCHPNGQLRMTVCDDGIGLPAVPKAGRGLANMQRRARDIGGRLDFERLEPGTRVSLTLPLSQAGKGREPGSLP